MSENVSLSGIAIELDVSPLDVDVARCLIEQATNQPDDSSYYESLYYSIYDLKPNKYGVLSDDNKMYVVLSEQCSMENNGEHHIAATLNDLVVFEKNVPKELRPYVKGDPFAFSIGWYNGCDMPDLLTGE